MIWLGVDDTDSPEGGCTTFTLTEILGEARKVGIDLIGEPRLVRLNPNVPWKTRGNAALSARFGTGAGRRRKVGTLDGRPLWAFTRSGRVAPETLGAFAERAWDVVRSTSRLGEPGTDPALVVTAHRLPASLYWRAVQDLVPVEEVRSELARRGTWWRTAGSDRGLVGASAAVAWPGGHPTWELIAYRTADREGRPRDVDAVSVREAQRAHPSLFLCHDSRTRRLLVAPHTACPILFGLRSTDPASALRARPLIRSEPVDRWVLFKTNQASGDHLRHRPLGDMGPYVSGIVDGTVVGAPTILKGGHVLVPFVDAAGVFAECLAFEPTKTLPRVARSLVTGDRLQVWGSRADDATIRIEGIRLQGLAPRFVSPGPPYCPACLRRARSLGRARGFRCPGCHRRWPPEAARPRRGVPEHPLGMYHPTPSARRHLAPRAPEP